MLLNVPGRMSPTCLGTTVWHDPQRTTTCEPLCRTWTQPNLTNRCQSGLKVLEPFYQARRFVPSKLDTHASSHSNFPLIIAERENSRENYSICIGGQQRSLVVTEYHP